MSNPFLQLLGSVSNNEGLLKNTLLRIQEGSTFEVLNQFVFFMVEPSVLSMFDWIVPNPTPIFIVAKMPLIDDIMNSGGKDSVNRDDMCNLLKSILFKEICHINTTNQPFPKIYSDDKKTVLDISYLSPLSYEESFEIQMLRCYIRLLPTIPFLLYYEDNNVNYWMIQSFDGANSSTTTVHDQKRTIPFDVINQEITSLPILYDKEKVTATIASLLVSSSSLQSIHSQLYKANLTSFVMAFASFPMTSSLSDLSLPLTTSVDMLVRYSPQVYKTLCLEADLFHEQLHFIWTCFTHPSEWSCLDETVIRELQVSTDYTDKIYTQSLSCDSQQSVVSLMKQFLSAIPTYSTLPTLQNENTTQLAHLVKEGMEVLREIQLTPSQADPLTSSWMSRIQSETGFLDKWVEIGLFSVTCQVLQAYTKRGLLSDEISPPQDSLQAWKEWLDKKIRVLGVLNLIETGTSASPVDLQNCLNIVEKPSFLTPSACMLMTLPMELAVKVGNTLPSPDICLIHRKRESGNEKRLELNEIESEEMNLFTNKEMMKEHYRTQEELQGMRGIIESVCGKNIGLKAIQCYEERNA